MLNLPQMVFCSTLVWLCTATSSWANNLEDVNASSSALPSALNLLQSLHQRPNSQNLTVPKIQEIYTEQAVRTLFVSSSELPIIDLQLTFNAGSARDESIAKGLFGLAHVTAQLLNQGTTAQSAAEIAANFSKVGAQYTAQAYRDMFIIRLRVSSDPQLFEPAIQQLIQILKHADFSQESFDLLFNNVSIGQKQVQENPSRSLNVRFYRTVYGQHPYAEPSTGTVQSLKKITPQNLSAFHKRYLVNKNLNIALTGDLTVKQAKQIADLISQNLAMGETASPLPKVNNQPTSKVIILPFDSTQAHVMIGKIAIPHQHPDRLALQLANEILGGAGFTSLLMQELREKRGLSYSASSQLSSLQSEGVFTINYATRQDQLLESLAVTYKTMFDFMEKPLDPTLVENIKTSMLRKFPQNFSSNANLNAQLGAIGFYQLPRQYLEDYAKNIQNIEAQDIQRAWKTHLNLQDLVTLVAGKNIPAKQIEVIYQQHMQLNTPNSIMVVEP